MEKIALTESEMKKLFKDLVPLVKTVNDKKENQYNTKVAMDLKQIKQAAFDDELKKIAESHGAKPHHLSGIPMIIHNAGQGGKIGAIAGGATGFAVAHKLMNTIGKNWPKSVKAAGPIKGAAMIAGALLGGDTGAYIGAGIGGAEKITSHL